MTETIDRLARIARIELTQEERTQFEKELAQVLAAFEVLSQADTKGVEPALHPVPLSSSERPDIPSKCLGQKDALANTPHKEKGFVKGPKVL